MRLGELAADLALGTRDAAIDITGLTADSRAVRPGFLFAALKGAASDGARFVGDAVGKGAAAVLAGSDVAVEASVPVIRVEDPRKTLALMAARFHPRQPAHLVAVTGTSGKTSVSVFTRQIFAAAGHPAASIGTIGVVSPKGATYGGLTTPDPVELHRILDELAGEGVTHAALEASSHGLDQRRLDGLRIEAAGFTNLGRDHMDYHPTVEHYLAAKLRLITEILPPDGTAVIDGDTQIGEKVEVEARRAGRRTFVVGHDGHEIWLVEALPEGTGQRLVVEVLGRRYHSVLLPLAGSFQASNALVAAGLAISAGVAPDIAVEALQTLDGAPGRLEKVGETADGAAIFVDYAHKPDAIRAVLAALRPMTRGRLVVLFGAGGDRDAGKRPLMGAAAAEGADIVIVTDDNPRSENPAAIRSAILEAAPGAIEIAGRAAAIREAVAMLRSGDVLVVAGKGHETGQIVGSETLPFSDHEAVTEALRGMAA